MANDNIYTIFETLPRQSLPPSHPTSGMTYLYVWQDDAKMTPGEPMATSGVRKVQRSAETASKWRKRISYIRHLRNWLLYTRFSYTPCCKKLKIPSFRQREIHHYSAILCMHYSVTACSYAVLFVAMSYLLSVNLPPQLLHFQCSLLHHHQKESSKLS